MARHPLTAIELEDRSHLALMNMAAAINVDADYRWETRVDYLGRSVFHQRLNPLHLIFDATLNRITV